MDVKQGHAVTFAGWPASRFYFQRVTKEELKDQRNQWRNYQFVIELIYRLANDDKSVIEQQLEDAMEAVLNLIDADYTLGGTADNCITSGGEIREVDAPWGISLVLPIAINAYTLQFF